VSLGLEPLRSLTLASNKSTKGFVWYCCAEALKPMAEKMIVERSKTDFFMGFKKFNVNY
jgi:hypothetical protein